MSEATRYLNEQIAKALYVANSQSVHLDRPAADAIDFLSQAIEHMQTLVMELHATDKEETI